MMDRCLGEMVNQEVATYTENIMILTRLAGRWMSKIVESESCNSEFKSTAV